MYYDYSFLRLVPAFIWAISIILGFATWAWVGVMEDGRRDRLDLLALFFGYCFVAVGLPCGKLLYWIAVNMIGL